MFYTSQFSKIHLLESSVLIYLLKICIQVFFFFLDPPVVCLFLLFINSSSLFQFHSCICTVNDNWRNKVPPCSFFSLRVKTKLHHKTKSFRTLVGSSSLESAGCSILVNNDKVLCASFLIHNFLVLMLTPYLQLPSYVWNVRSVYKCHNRISGGSSPK